MNCIFQIVNDSKNWWRCINSEGQAGFVPCNFMKKIYYEDVSTVLLFIKWYLATCFSNQKSLRIPLPSNFVIKKISSWILFIKTDGSTMVSVNKVEIFLEQREVAFLSPSKICENLNFSTEIQIFANFAGW